MNNQIKINLKNFRKLRDLSQEELAKRLNISRSTYTKIESGKTKLDLDLISKICTAMNIKVSDILNEKGSLSSTDELILMLYQTEYFLEKRFIEAIPFEQLSWEQKKFLRKRGIVLKEEYITPHYGGRLFKTGHRDIFKMMMDQCGMKFIFEKSLPLGVYWSNKWDLYKTNTNEPEVDLNDYFDVILFILKMPNSGEDECRNVQMAIRDIPDGYNEYSVIDYVIERCGAESGEAVAWTPDGYDPLSDIIRKE